MDGAIKVGALAKKTGLTVRTLHHYDEIGLLVPSGRTPSGHRLYGERDVARLQQIASLKHIGLALDEIRECLEHPEYTLQRTLDLQLERIQEEIERHERLRHLVTHLRDRVRAAERVTVEELTRTIEVTTTYARHYSPEQLRWLDRRAAAVGEERIRKAQEEWSELFAGFEDAMGRGLDPSCDEVRMLARRSAALIDEFTGGDPGIRRSLQEMYRTEGSEAVMAGHGMPRAPGLWDFMSRARAALEGG